MELTKGVAYAKAINTKQRSVEAVVSTETVDRVGDIIDQATWRLEQFKRNPVVLFQHNMAAPIGRAEDIAVRDGRLEATIVFASTPRADEILQLYIDRALRAFSVGFRVGRVEKEIGEAGRSVMRLLDCDLFEISAVSIPANPDALAKAKSLGLVPPDWHGGRDVSAGEELVRLATDRAHGKSLALVPPAPTASGVLLAEVQRMANRDEDDDGDPLHGLFGGAA